MTSPPGVEWRRHTYLYTSPQRAKIGVTMGNLPARPDRGFSTSRQHPTIGETGVKPLAQTVFLVVRSRKHRMDGRGAQYTSLRDNREKNHAQRFSRTSVFGSRAAGIADVDRALSIPWPVYASE